MKSKDEMIGEYLSKYSERHCLLVKKYRTIFHYVWVLEDGKSKFKFHIGKSLYLQTPIGSRLTIGKIEKNLINIRSGFEKLDK